MEAEIILNTKKLDIGYGNNYIAKNLMLQLYAGEMVCLIGPNGCGKSTLIRTLVGLQDSLGGNMEIKGKKLNKISLSEKSKLISWVLTDNMPTGSLKVSEIVEMGRFPYTNWFGKLSEIDKNIINNAIEAVHLTHKKDYRYNSLSDGEKQRTMIAKALAQDTPIIFLDEPTSHLDLPNTIEIMQLLRELARKTKKAILLSTHELELTLQVADKIWMMAPNKLTKGLPEDLILSGSLQKTFGTERFRFDETTGGFRMNYPASKQISLQGDKGVFYYWTERALLRNGYKITENSPLWINIKGDGKWDLHLDTHHQEFYTIENLLFTMSEWETKFLSE